MPEDVTIRGDVIRLGQFLKLTGVAGSGAGARALLEAGEVSVDGVVEGRRGRQLRHGAVIDAGGARYRVVATPAAPVPGRLTG